MVLFLFMILQTTKSTRLNILSLETNLKNENFNNSSVLKRDD